MHKALRAHMEIISRNLVHEICLHSLGFYAAQAILNRIAVMCISHSKQQTAIAIKVEMCGGMEQDFISSGSISVKGLQRLLGNLQRFVWKLAEGALKFEGDFFPIFFLTKIWNLFVEFEGIFKLLK